MSAGTQNIALLLRYDGSHFHGWQSQKNASSVQDTIEKAIETLTGTYPSPRLEGCGRTDAGVHALGYVASFRSACTIPTERLPYAMKPLLPASISIKEARTVPDDFHARFSCRKKEYLYMFYSERTPDPFLLGRAYFSPLKLDAHAMEEAAAMFEGYHDFSAFRAVGSDVKTTERTIFSCRLTADANRYTLSVSADGFLYNMVRIIAGTLYYVGLGRLRPGDIADIIASRDRTRSGVTLPPHGLYLNRVWYDELDF